MVIDQNRNKIENELDKPDIAFTAHAAFSGEKKAEKTRPNIINKGAPGG